jgi:hypothetical protein
MDQEKLKRMQAQVRIGMSPAQLDFKFDLCGVAEITDNAV